jgi:L-alanine-DL-glutamate epimerase-like enolase superfamily enzyme
MKVPDGHGLGVTVDVAKLAKYRVEDASPGGS